MLTLTRVRITVIDSKTAFMGVGSSVSLKVVKISMSVLSIVAIAEWCSTAEGVLSIARDSKVDMVYEGEGKVVSSRIVGHAVHARATYRKDARTKRHPSGGLTPNQNGLA